MALFDSRLTGIEDQRRGRAGLVEARVQAESAPVQTCNPPLSLTIREIGTGPISEIVFSNAEIPPEKSHPRPHTGL